MKNRLLTFFVALACSWNFSVVAQGDEIFIVVEVQPEFPGGNDSMFKFLNSNLKYPSIARDNNIQGLVIVNFVVEKDGSLSNFKILKGVDPELDSEAVRVVKLMPKWIPGTQRGQPVRVSVNIPVRFTLADDNKEKTDETVDSPFVDIDDIAEDLKLTSWNFSTSYFVLSTHQWIDFPANATLLPLRNREVGIYQMTNMLKKTKHINVALGTYWSFMNVHSNVSQVSKYETDSTGFTSVYDTSISGYKNKLTSIYLGIPIELKFKIGKNMKKTINIGIGYKAGYRLYTASKFRQGDLKTKLMIRENISDFSHGLYGQIGFRYFSIFGSYYLSPFFDNNLLPATKSWTLGLGFVL